MPSDALPDDSETLKAMLLAERVQNERLRQIIRELQRHRFGRRAETLPEDQMLLGLEDVEQAEANRAAETDGSSPSDRQVRAHKRRINRGALPAHLPRIETVVDIDVKTCPCCQRELHPLLLFTVIFFSIIHGQRSLRFKNKTMLSLHFVKNVQLLMHVYRSIPHSQLSPVKHFGIATPRVLWPAFSSFYAFRPLPTIP